MFVLFGIDRVATGVVGEHAQRQPHVAGGQFRQRVIDRAEVVLEIVGSVGRQRARIGGLQLPPGDTQAGVIRRGPRRIPPLGGIGLREKRHQEVFVLAAQRIGYLLNGERYGRTDHRGERAGVDCSAQPLSDQRRARKQRPSFSLNVRTIVLGLARSRIQRQCLAIGEKRHRHPARGQQRFHRIARDRARQQNPCAR